MYFTTILHKTTALHRFHSLTSSTPDLTVSDSSSSHSPIQRSPSVSLSTPPTTDPALTPITDLLRAQSLLIFAINATQKRCKATSPQVMIDALYPRPDDSQEALDATLKSNALEQTRTQLSLADLKQKLAPITAQIKHLSILNLPPYPDSLLPPRPHLPFDQLNAETLTLLTAALEKTKLTNTYYSAIQNLHTFATSIDHHLSVLSDQAAQLTKLLNIVETKKLALAKQQDSVQEKLDRLKTNQLLTQKVQSNSLNRHTLEALHKAYESRNTAPLLRKQATLQTQIDTEVKNLLRLDITPFQTVQNPDHLIQVLKLIIENPNANQAQTPHLLLYAQESDLPQTYYMLRILTNNTYCLTLDHLLTFLNSPHGNPEQKKAILSNVLTEATILSLNGATTTQLEQLHHESPDLAHLWIQKQFLLTTTSIDQDNLRALVIAFVKNLPEKTPDLLKLLRHPNTPAPLIANLLTIADTSTPELQVLLPTLLPRCSAHLPSEHLLDLLTTLTQSADPQLKLSTQCLVAILKNYKAPIDNTALAKFIHLTFSHYPTENTEQLLLACLPHAHEDALELWWTLGQIGLPPTNQKAYITALHTPFSQRFAEIDALKETPSTIRAHYLQVQELLSDTAQSAPRFETALQQLLSAHPLRRLLFTPDARTLLVAKYNALSLEFGDAQPTILAQLQALGCQFPRTSTTPEIRRVPLQTTTTINDDIATTKFPV